MAHIPDTKLCAKCKIDLPTKMFGTSKQNPNGLKSYCRPCCNSENRKYYKRNKNVINKKNMEWAVKNPELIAKYSKKWRDANKETVANLKKEWRENNYDKYKAQKQNWRKNNTDRAKLYSAKRRALKKANSIYLVTKNDIQKISKLSCIYCGGKFEHIDHVIPLSRGGSHSIGNLAPSCAGCNISKGSKLISEWKYQVRYN